MLPFSCWTRASSHHHPLHGLPWLCPEPWGTPPLWSVLSQIQGIHSLAYQQCFWRTWSNYVNVHLKLLAPSIFSAFSSNTSMLSKKSILGGKSVRSMHGGGSSTGGGGSAAPSSPDNVTGHDLNHSLLKCYLQQEVVPQQEEHQPCLREWWWVILVELMQILTWCQWSVADTERGESRVRLRGVRAEVIMTRGHQVTGWYFMINHKYSREWVRLSIWELRFRIFYILLTTL